MDRIKFNIEDQQVHNLFCLKPLPPSREVRDWSRLCSSSSGYGDNNDLSHIYEIGLNSP